MEKNLLQEPATDQREVNIQSVRTARKLMEEKFNQLLRQSTFTSKRNYVI